MIEIADGLLEINIAHDLTEDTLARVVSTLLHQRIALISLRNAVDGHEAGEVCDSSESCLLYHDAVRDNFHCLHALTGWSSLYIQSVMDDIEAWAKA